MNAEAQTPLTECHQRTNFKKPQNLILQLVETCIYTFVRIFIDCEKYKCATNRFISEARKVLRWDSAKKEKESDLRSAHFHIQIHAFGASIL